MELDEIQFHPGEGRGPDQPWIPAFAGMTRKLKADKIARTVRRQHMNQAEFEKKCAAEGYGEMVDRHMDAGQFNPEHAHDFDACVLVVEGEMTITRHGKPETFRAGDMCALAAGTPHTEKCGPAGAHYLAGRRYPAKAAS
jgi:quercetin dioxygenase-like cupin family protein